MRAAESGENPRPGRAPPSAIGGEGAGRAPRRPRTGQRRRRLAARHRRGDKRGGSRLLRGVAARRDLAAATVRNRVVRLPALTARAGVERSRPGWSPRDEGNTSHCPSKSSAAASSTLSAQGESGTRCSRPAFMRSAGIVHAAPSRSICSHRALRTSPEHAAVTCATHLEALSRRVRCPCGIVGARVWAGGGQRCSPSCSVGALAGSLPLPRCRSIRNVGSGKGCPPVRGQLPRDEGPRSRLV